MPKNLQNHRLSILLFIFTLLGAPLSLTQAQSSNLNLTQTAEYDIGFTCPVASVMDATGTILWVLMDNCVDSNYSLHAYDPSTGEQVNEDDYTDALSTLNGVYIDGFIQPLGLRPDGDLSIRYNDPDSYASVNIIVPITSGGEVTSVTNTGYDDLLFTYTDYPDFSIYSPDHSMVIAIGESSFHVIDVQTESEIAEFSIEDSSDSARGEFSQNSEHFYLIHYSSPDTIEATLFIYDLPSGELLGEYPVPSDAIWVSPDETVVAANLYSFNGGERNELIIYDLETGLSSQAVNLNEDPAPVTKCLNNGNDMSDVDFRTSGNFSFSYISWLPDSSNLLVPLSYGGESAGSTGSICIFNYSRLRSYAVERSG